VRETLHDALAAGGSTLRDFVGSDGQPGYFQQQYFVYGRDGEPCRRAAPRSARDHGPAGDLLLPPLPALKIMHFCADFGRNVLELVPVIAGSILTISAFRQCGSRRPPGMKPDERTHACRTVLCLYRLAGKWSPAGIGEPAQMAATNEIGDAQSDLRLQYLLERLREDKLTWPSSPSSRAASPN
jgi:hypothetical protein